MTVKDLIEKLKNMNPESLVYTMAHDDDIAVIVLDVYEDVLTGTDKTITMVY